MNEVATSAAKNLLLNRGNEDVQELLAAGPGATQEQRKKAADKYLAPFMEGESEFQKVLLDEILKLATDEEKLNALEKHLSGTPVTMGDFNPKKFLDNAAQHAALEKEAAKAPEKIKSEAPPEGAVNIPAVQTPEQAEAMASAAPTKTEGRLEERYNITMPTAPPPPPPPPPGAPAQPQQQAAQEDYIGEQLSDSKAPAQPTPQSHSEPSDAPEGAKEGDKKSMRDAKKEGLEKKQAQQQQQEYNDALAENMKAQQEQALQAMAEESAAEAAAASATPRLQPTGFFAKLKTPKGIATASVIGGGTIMGGILGLGGSLSM